MSGYRTWDRDPDKFQAKAGPLNLVLADAWDDLMAFVSDMIMGSEAHQELNTALGHIKQAQWHLLRARSAVRKGNF